MFFGQELRRYRTAAGLSQEQLGAKINYTGTFIGLIEQAKRSCPQHVAERADVELDARGALLNLWAVVNEEVHPAWLQPYIRAEAEAAHVEDAARFGCATAWAWPRNAGQLSLDEPGQERKLRLVGDVARCL